MNNKTPYIVKIVLLALLLIFLIIAAVRFVNYGIGGLGVFTFGTPFGGKELVSSESFDGVDKVKIDSVSYSVYIEEYSGSQVVAEFLANGVGAAKVPEFKLDGDTLKIAQKPNIGIDTSSGQIHVKVPSNSELDYEIDSVSGSVKVYATSSDLDIESSSGSIHAKGGKTAEVESISGSVKLEEPFKTIKVSSVSGSVKLWADGDTKSIHVDSTSGSVKIGLRGVDGYTLDFDSVSGSVKDTYNSTSGEHSGTLKTGDGSLSINVETISGSIKLTDWSD